MDPNFGYSPPFRLDLGAEADGQFRAAEHGAAVERALRSILRRHGGRPIEDLVDVHVLSTGLLQVYHTAAPQIDYVRGLRHAPPVAGWP